MKNRHPLFFVPILGLIGLLCLNNTIQAQRLTHFSADSSQFLTELGLLFSGISDQEKKLIEPGIKNFTNSWIIGRFDQDQQKIIRYLCNEMVKKKVRAFPDFYTYLDALNIFLETQQPAELFTPWSEILKKLIAEKNSRKYLVFLEFTTNLFAEQLVYKSASTRWKFYNPVFRLRYDSVPWVEFSESSLVCYANNDSLNIEGTLGVYYPLTNVWKGKGGEVTWMRAGEDPAKIYALLDRYEIQMRYSKYTADSVSFRHARFFPTAILGKLEDKVLADVTIANATYPRFYSYGNLIGIARIFPNMDYLGGFAIEGSRVIGSGSASHDARLFFKRDGHDFVTAASRTFIIYPDRINANNASVTIYHDNDSIFHPGLQLKYLDEKKTLSITRDERTANISPWFDSFHQIEIYCDALYYKVGDTRISFEVMANMGKERKAIFESSNCYSQYRYERIQGMDEVNPLDVISRYSNHIRTREITLEGLTGYMNKPAEQVEWILLNLGNKGFLVYEPSIRVAHLKDKLFNYVKARNAKADYDVISYNSTVTDMPNAVLNLETFDLKIQGVPMVALSDSQGVYIYPIDSVVVLKKNMDFKFTGKIEAGFFKFHVHDGSFDYNQFKINLPFIDSMTFSVRDKKRDPLTGAFPLVRIRDAITRLGGELLIDDSTNKSGLKALVEYPVFINKNNSFVFWDRPSIRNGAYKKEKFYYELQPFTLKSLDIVTTDSLRFLGALTSAGIFPAIEEPLRVRPDFSLGFEKMTDTSGLALYGGKGTFYSRIDLSDRGLRGDGRINYLNSTSSSGEFVFLPESMQATARSFRIAETLSPAEFPEVTADSVRQHWLPYRDSLLITSTTRAMNLYRNEASFNGTLAYSPGKLTGNGTLKINEAQMEAKDFNFATRGFDALTSYFRINATDNTKPVLATRNYQSHFDMDRKRGQFIATAGPSKVDFPFNQYTCSSDRFEWKIDSNRVFLNNDGNPVMAADTSNYQRFISLDYTGSEFISTHPKQDSLRFFASGAAYDLHDQVIRAINVRIIKVADAAVFPDSGKVNIFPDARIQLLENAVVIADTGTQLHRFFNAKVALSSRKAYTATGDYGYKDRTGAVTTLHFDRIKVDTSGQTTASGSIPDSSGFMMSPEFAFKGEITLLAAQPALRFDGAFKTVTACLPYKTEWIHFEGNIDPKSVKIPLQMPLRTLNNETAFTGMVYSNSETRVIPALFRRKGSFSDSTILAAGGFVTYLPETKEFRLGSEEKLRDLSAPGDYVSLSTYNCRIRGEGKLNLGVHSGGMKMETFGTIDHYLIPDSTRAVVTIALQFPFSDQALQRFITLLESVNLTGVNLRTTPYTLAMENQLGKEELTQARSEMEMIGKYRKFPDALDRTLFLADVTMTYDTASNSWVSHGPIGIASIGKTSVNRYVNGIIEFSKKRKDDDFTLYFQLDPDEWFFFNFRGNILQSISSDLNFNDILTAAVRSKAEMDRVDKLVKGYRYTISTDRKKRDFLRKFETPEEP